MPAVASAVYKAKELGTGPIVNIKGAAIGNGLTNPAIQFGAYADYALENGVITQRVSREGCVCGGGGLNGVFTQMVSRGGGV